MQYNTEDMIVLILCVMMMSIGILYLCKYNTRCFTNSSRPYVTPTTPEEIPPTPPTPPTPAGYIHPIQEIPPLPT
jgi:hypothetical protein